MSAIEWTDRSDWNPLRGCTRVSEGCRNCYAETIAARFSDPGQPFHGFATRTASGPRWTGKVELIESRLTLPLKWRKPARIFANSASDFFHDAVPDAVLDRLFAVMIAAQRHTFQVLTKRPERMQQWMAQLQNAVEQSFTPGGRWMLPRNFPEIAEVVSAGAFANPPIANVWPQPNIWLGTSVEDQAAANERIPHLLKTPAAIRFLSCEPLLGPVDLSPWIERIDWVIVGGESGRDARPISPDWVLWLRDQCAAAGVPFFFKQWGEWLPSNNPVFLHIPKYERLNVHGHAFWRVGKTKAGRDLEGRTHSAMPEDEK